MPKLGKFPQRLRFAQPGAMGTVRSMTHRIVPAWTMGDRLRKAREQADLSSQQMADHLVVSRNTIRNYESGHTTNIPAAKLAKWAEVTRVPAVWLLTGDDESSDQATTSCPWTLSTPFPERRLTIPIAA